MDGAEYAAYEKYILDRHRAGLGAHRHLYTLGSNGRSIHQWINDVSMHQILPVIAAIAAVEQLERAPVPGDESPLELLLGCCPQALQVPVPELCRHLLPALAHSTLLPLDRGRYLDAVLDHLQRTEVREKVYKSRWEAFMLENVAREHPSWITPQISYLSDGPAE